MFKRICIFGRPGSGKSTFALKLHKETNLPIYHLDKYFYQENWIPRDYQEFLNIQQEIVNKDCWIVDGNSLQSLEMRYAKSEIVLYFNFSRWLCIFRLLKRYFIKDKDIKDRAQGCKENIRWDLIKYLWTFEYRKNNRLINQIKEFKLKYPDVVFIEVSNTKDLDKLFNSKKR